MAKMKMAPRDRPRVKLECLRLLASLRLDPARATLIGGFIDSYLRLTAQEMKEFERELSQFTPEEREATMELTHIWEPEAMAMGRVEGITQGISQGISQGIVQGKETLVARLLRRRLGAVPADVTARLEQLSPDQLDDLGEALLDFSSIADLEQWLSRH